MKAIKAALARAKAVSLTQNWDDTYSNDSYVRAEAKK